MGVCRVLKKDKVHATGSLHGNLYELGVFCSTTLQCTASRLLANMMLLYERFSHVDPSRIQSMSAHQVVTRFDIPSASGSEHSPKCFACTLGKAHLTAIPKESLSQTSGLLELIHYDLNGHMEVNSLGGSRHFVTFIDDFSKWTIACLIKRKSDIFETLKKYRAFSEKETGQRNKALRSDS